MLLGAYRGSIAANAALIAEYITTPEAHGWSDGNTVQQNTDAFNAACADASANAGNSSTGRGVVELVPGKTYVVSAPNGVRNFPEGAIVLDASRPNVEIRTQGKPVVGGNQAVIQIAPWAGQTGVRQRSIVYFKGTNNCKLGWVKLDGNKISCGSTFTERNDYLSNGGIDYSEGGNGGLHNILFQGSGNCMLVHVDSSNALSDGLVTRRLQDDGSRVLNLLVEDCDFHHNRRQGYTPTGSLGDPNLTWDQIVFRRCKFRATGDEAGVIWGQAPAAGVDIEPLQTSFDTWGMSFYNCEFNDQAGSSFDSASGGPISFRTSRGLASDTHADVRYFRIIDCVANNNTGEAYQINMRDGADYEDVEMINLVASGNGNNRIGFFDAQGPAGDSQVRDAIIVNANVGLIFFEDELADTGHSVTIWKGDFNPTITTSDRATITINNGFPP